MLHRLFFAVYFAALAFVAATGLSEAAKGPDAAKVAFGTLIVVIVAMAVLGLLYLLRVAFAGAGSPAAEEEPAAGGHH